MLYFTASFSCMDYLSVLLIIVCFPTVLVLLIG